SLCKIDVKNHKKKSQDNVAAKDLKHRGDFRGHEYPTLNVLSSRDSLEVLNRDRKHGSLPPVDERAQEYKD
ncbi:hypothetical protein ACJ72_07081, partial [Emergomyces africanus]